MKRSNVDLLIGEGAWATARRRHLADVHLKLKLLSRQYIMRTSFLLVALSPLLVISMTQCYHGPVNGSSTGPQIMEERRCTTRDWRCGHPLSLKNYCKWG